MSRLASASTTSETKQGGNHRDGKAIAMYTRWQQRVESFRFLLSQFSTSTQLDLTSRLWWRLVVVAVLTASGCGFLLFLSLFTESKLSISESR
jgi:hypothetical protein